MRAFLEKTVLKDYFDDYVFTSKYQLQNLGVDVIDFDGSNLASLDKYTMSLKNDIMIGSVEACSKFFTMCGVKEPEYIGYPEELHKFLGRTITSCKFKDINSPYPYFIKPKGQVKLFTGSVVESEKSNKFMEKYYEEVTPDTEVYISSVLKFESEYRCFVHKGELQAIQHYEGNIRLFPDVKRIDDMIQKYKSSNVSYTLDVGLVCLNDWQNFYETYLIEVNDMWAIGSYGFDAKKYVRMTIDRFQEIYKNSLGK
jgi:hypothetical protein